MRTCRSCGYDIRWWQAEADLGRHVGCPERNVLQDLLKATERFVETEMEWRRHDEVTRRESAERYY